MCENFKGNSYDSENILSAIKRKKSGIYPSKYEDILSYVRCFKDIATKGILQNFFFFVFAVWDMRTMQECRWTEIAFNFCFPKLRNAEIRVREKFYLRLCVAAVVLLLTSSELQFHVAVASPYDLLRGKSFSSCIFYVLIGNPIFRRV